MNEQNYLVEALIRALRDRWGRNISVPSDCEMLAKDITKKTSLYISVNTVKRLLGFLPYDKSHRLSTLHVIAQYLGYASWDDLTVALSGKNSGFEDIPTLEAAALSQGAELMISYAPDRLLRLIHHDGNSFTVTASEHSKLKAGDNIVVAQFTVGYPLFATRVIRDGSELGSFTAGKVGGILSIKLRS